MKKLASLIASSGLLGLSLCKVALDGELEAELINANLVEVILCEVQQVFGAFNILQSQLQELLGEILACGSRDALKELLSAVTGQPVIIVGDDLRYRFRHELGPVEVFQGTCFIMLVLELSELEAAASNKVLGIELHSVSG